MRNALERLQIQGENSINSRTARTATLTIAALAAGAAGFEDMAAYQFRGRQTVFGAGKNRRGILADLVNPAARAAQPAARTASQEK